MSDPWPRRGPWEPPAGPAEDHGSAEEPEETGLIKGSPGTGTRSAADQQKTSIRPRHIGGRSVVPHKAQKRPRRDQQQSTAMSRAIADPQKTTKGPDVRLKQPRCAPSGTQWSPTGLSGPSRVLYGSCLCPCLAMLGHRSVHSGTRRSPAIRAPINAWNTRRRHLEAVLGTPAERAEELSGQGGAVVVAPVASPIRPGAAGRAEGKGEPGCRAPHGATGQRLRFLPCLTGGGCPEGENP